MTTQVEFLLLDKECLWSTIAVKLIADLYQNFDRVLVLSDKRVWLEQLDEMLWHQSAEQFVAYSLDSECYENSVPVLLTTEQPAQRRFNSLLNINGEMCQMANQFRKIIELVEFDESSKERARERYKQYRHLGFLVTHREITPT